MAHLNFALLTQRRYLPLFIVQFLGAFNDNVVRFAMLFLASFALFHDDPAHAAQLAIIATGLFMLPYFLFSSLAGQIADSADKAALIRWIKGAEVIIMSIGLIGFALQSIGVLLFVLFLMGAHSTIFGPVKYAILPQHLTPDEIMGGTGLIEAGTFIAILGGQLLGGVVMPWMAGLIASGLAILGFAASLMIPAAPPDPHAARIEANLCKSTWHVMKMALARPSVWLAILGISWFFAVGAVLLSTFAPLVGDVLHADKSVATFFLLTFSISIAFGALFIGWRLSGMVTTRSVKISALGMSAGLMWLWWSCQHFRIAAPDGGISVFLASTGSFWIVGALFITAFAGGTFIVPLYALLQTESDAETRAQIIAANNIMNAIMTVALVGGATLLLKTGLSIPQLIGVMGLATLVAALIAYRSDSVA